jgi:hypothetical protein|tara:strand:+ start:66 stop:755 length:690 start_codon:yes stop_codon:yes gene_type:complete
MSNVHDKIKKLLALSESANEHESNLAFEMANQLMRDHMISKDDLIDDDDVIGYEVIEMSNSAHWYASLMWAMATGFRCRVVRKKRSYYSQGHFTVFGSKGDRTTVKLMFDFALGQIDRLGKKEYQRVKGMQGRMRHYMNSYRTGVVTGMRETLEKLSKQNSNDQDQGYGIVLRDRDKQIKDMVKEMFPRLSSARVNTRMHSGAYHGGTKSGSSISFNRQANGRRVKQLT